MEFRDIQTIIGICITGILGILWWDIRTIKRHSIDKKEHDVDDVVRWESHDVSDVLRRADHDEKCELKINPMHNDIKELKKDMKELLRRNGGPRG